MPRSHCKVRDRECDDGHDTNCTLRLYKPDQAVLVPREERLRVARQYVLDHTPLRNLRTRVKRLWRSLPDSLLNNLPVLSEFSRLKGYDRAREIIIETCSEGAPLRQVLGLDPCEQCGRELTRWKWWEAIKVIEGQDERVAPVQIMGSFSTKEQAQQLADELK